MPIAFGISHLPTKRGGSKYTVITKNRSLGPIEVVQLFTARFVQDQTTNLSGEEVNYLAPTGLRLLAFLPSFLWSFTSGQGRDNTEQ